MIKKMYCIETDKNSLYVDKDVYDYIVSLEQQCIKQKEVIDKAIEYINQHWVIDDPVLFKNDLLEILEDGKNE